LFENRSFGGFSWFGIKLLLLLFLTKEPSRLPLIRSASLLCSEKEDNSFCFFSSSALQSNFFGSFYSSSASTLSFWDESRTSFSMMISQGSFDPLPDFPRPLIYLLETSCEAGEMSFAFDDSTCEFCSIRRLDFRFCACSLSLLTPSTRSDLDSSLCAPPSPSYALSLIPISTFSLLPILPLLLLRLLGYLIFAKLLFIPFSLS